MNYIYPSHFISSSLLLPDDGKAKLGGIIVFWRRNHLAQKKIGDLKDKDYNACRRDVMVGDLIGRNVVYPDNRRQICYPSPLCTLKDLLLEVGFIFFLLYMHFVAKYYLLLII